MIKALIYGLLGFLCALPAPASADDRIARSALAAGDYVRARLALEPDARAGDPRAQVMLGLLYEQGLGVALDYARAADWYLRAADQGDARGQYELGMQYLAGKGVERDNAEALKWLTKAAEQGLPEAQYRLGLLLRRGVVEGKERPAEAAEWLTKASRQGYGLAMARLGNMYRDGVGLTEDPVEAYAWYLLADAHRVPSVRPLLRVLEQSLGADQLAAAKARAEALGAEIE